MKHLIDSIQEKLVINKHSKAKQNDFDIFCKTLKLKDKNPDSEKLKKLFELYLNDCDKIIEKNFDGELASTNFELMFMSAAMLNADDQDWTSLPDLGYKDYPGYHNPYDYSWFEEEDSNGKTVLEVMQDLYHNDKKDPTFLKMFQTIYFTIDDYCKNYEKAIDGICELQDKI